VTARYLLTVTDADAARLERWLGFRTVILPAAVGAHQPVTIAGLDAITDEEVEFIARRLRTSGPIYHAGGPGRPGPAAVTGREAARSELSKLLGELWRDNPVARSALDEILRAADAYAATPPDPNPVPLNYSCLYSSQANR
jgi:hypothetical protein